MGTIRVEKDIDLSYMAHIWRAKSICSFGDPASKPMELVKMGTLRVKKDIDSSYMAHLWGENTLRKMSGVYSL